MLRKQFSGFFFQIVHRSDKTSATEVIESGSILNRVKSATYKEIAVIAFLSHSRLKDRIFTSLSPVKKIQ